MYKSFFGLKRSPFEISPDPYFFYATPRHNEALANLYYGIRRHKGFVVVTGEVGTGKTLLVHCLLETLRRSQIAFAYIFNTRLAPDDFLRYLIGDLGLSRSIQNKSEILLTFNDYLIERHRRGQSTALVIDEAQNLSHEVLEEIRLLTNLETSQQKLLQIVLVGQPELDAKLESVNLRQLKQRIALRCHLEPLSLNETSAYIERRLELAAGQHVPTIFPAETIDAVHRYSQGIPRLINTICENAMLCAYALQSPIVPPQIIDDVASDFRLHFAGLNGSQNGALPLQPIEEKIALNKPAEVNGGTEEKLVVSQRGRKHA